MIRVVISVEGQTEFEFCNQLLVPFFIKNNIQLTPIIVTTKREKCGKKYKGGCINLDRVKNELQKLLPNFDYVTTFYDFYGFKDIDENITVDELETEIFRLFNNEKLIPYIQKYEFETLLFSDSLYYEDYFDDKNAKIEIEKIINSCGGIENINNSPQTAPSKRIEKFFNSYDEDYNKIIDGMDIANEIGLDIIMQECSRFKSWIDRIKNLKSN